MARGPSLMNTDVVARMAVAGQVDVALESLQNADEGGNVGDSERNRSGCPPRRLLLSLAPFIVPWNLQDLQSRGSESQNSTGTGVVESAPNRYQRSVSPPVASRGFQHLFVWLDPGQTAADI